ncbi:MAG TPA: isochorismatase family protein [Chloroflexota bacterium]|nr:isochorismatase family protein [Chloroflexota bacterium]
MNEMGLARRSAAFLDYLDQLVAGLPEASLREVIERAEGPQRVAVVVVDVINGFCKFGSLASERVGQIVPPTARLLEAARDLGVTRVAVLRDSHHPEAPEFEQFAPHCQDGTEEAALVDELAGLSHAHTFADFPKNSISAWHGHDAVSDWVAGQEAAGVSTFVVCGDCTDLCVYQTAMALKLTANARNRQATVVVSAETVETYDLPVDVAQRLGAVPHDGDLLHAVFLYHLQLNGVQVVRRLA